MAAILYRERKTKSNPTDDTTVLTHRNLSLIRSLQNSYGLFDRLFISERNGNDFKASTWISNHIFFCNVIIRRFKGGKYVLFPTCL